MKKQNSIGVKRYVISAAIGFFLIAVSLCFTPKRALATATPWDGTSKDASWRNNSTYDGSTEVNAYRISTGAQLADLADQVNGGEKYSGKYFKLTDDINLNNKNWTPIGISNEQYFEGNFDGGGHKIYGFTIDSDIVEDGNDNDTFYRYGLFGCVAHNTSGNGLEIKDLSVFSPEGIHLCINDSNCHVELGGIVGYGYRVTMNNCCFEGGMVIEYSESPSDQSIHCGGNIGYASNLEITDSYHLGLINASLRGDDCNMRIGGIVGDLDSGSKIERCYHIGDLIGSCNSDNSNCCCCGGLTGMFYAQDTIFCLNSFSIGNVSFSNINISGSEYAGGIVGENSNYNTHDNISRCYSVGNGKNGELPSVGYNHQSSCNVSDCYYQSSASVTGDGRGVPKTEAAMKTASTFSGWDNSSVWSIEGGRYPILSGMSNPFTDYANISFAITGDDSGELSGLTSGKTYALSGNSLVNGSTDVIADSNGKAAVSNITVGTLTVSSEWTTVLGSVLSISKLSSPTGVGKVDCSDSSTNDGQLTGVSTDMEYKKSTDTSWTPCTATTVTGLAAGDYYVRMKHTTTQLASDYVTLSISAPSTTPTPPPTTPYVPSYDPPAPEPRINGGAGWNSISDSITKTVDGGTINIDMNGTTNFSGKVINTLQGKDVNVVLDMGNGIKWTINGKNITNPIGDINMGVSIGSSLIPVDVINNLTGDRYSMQIKLAHNGPFGFSATLTIPMRVQDAGLFANLFRYVKNKNVKAARAAADVTYDSTDSGTMEFMGVGKIADDGSVDLLFDGAPDSEKGSAESAYAIVVDDHSLDPSIVPEPEPEVLTLKSTSKKGKVALSWNKLTGAKKYRIYQKIGKKYKMLTELKKKKFTVKKAYKKVKVKIKKKEKTTLELKKLTAGKEYTFVVKAFVDGKWTKVTKQATKKVKVKK